MMVAFLGIVVFFMVDIISGAEYDVIMWVATIRMSCYDI